MKIKVGGRILEATHSPDKAYYYVAGGPTYLAREVVEVSGDASASPAEEKATADEEKPTKKTTTRRKAS